MDIDINQRNYDNYEDILGKPHKRVVLSSNSGDLVNPATSDNQTNGSQKTQVVDSSGNSITSDDNKLDVMAELIPVFRSLLLAITNPSYVDKSANQMRSQVTGSLTTVTNLTNLGSFPADHLQRMNNMTAWATNIRSLIT
jgi:transcriptional regulator with PAS, ATPase and Fis domain